MNNVIDKCHFYIILIPTRLIGYHHVQAQVLINVLLRSVETAANKRHSVKIKAASEGAAVVIIELLKLD